MIPLMLYAGDWMSDDFKKVYRPRRTRYVGDVLVLLH